MLKSSLQGPFVFKRINVMTFHTFRLGYPACNVQVIRMNGVILKTVGLRQLLLLNKDTQEKNIASCTIKSMQQENHISAISLLSYFSEDYVHSAQFLGASGGPSPRGQTAPGVDRMPVCAPEECPLSELQR